MTPDDMGNSISTEPLAEHSRRLKHLLQPLKSRVKRKANGALKYDFLCPGGPYDEQWDWDGYFIGAALARDDVTDAAMHENYDAETGEPLAAPGFVGWNLLVLNMLDDALGDYNPFDLPPT